MPPVLDKFTSVLNENKRKTREHVKHINTSVYAENAGLNFNARPNPAMINNLQNPYY